MKWQKLQQTAQHGLMLSVKSRHNLIVTMGLLVGVAYAPIWLTDVLVGTIHGAASLLMVAAIALGLFQLWQRRHSLAKLEASDDERWFGHLLILGGVVTAPFWFSTEWAIQLILMLILAGSAASQWGLPFFGRYPIPVLLIFVGLFPQPTTVGKIVWETFTPPDSLERIMAWAGMTGLKLIGQPATLDGTIIALPSGAVNVYWGCNGFDMASIVAVASLVLGIFLKQKPHKVVLLVLIGIVLALLANVPRIMLMAMAEAYWGKASFEFWHGFWGGQIFSSILFTIYYYVLMALIKQRRPSAVSSHKS